MRYATIIMMMIALAVFVGPRLKITRVVQGETCFAYDLTDGRAVNEANNPTLPFGINTAWGLSARFFCVSSEVNSWTFSSQPTEASPYDESMGWDSKEGVTMAGDVFIEGAVEDVWLFYNSFGKVEGGYPNVAGITDQRLYEALRQTGDFVDARMGEKTQSVEAEEIRRSPGSYGISLTTDAAEYMTQFGFRVARVSFPQRFEFPGGNAIDVARETIRTVNSEIEQKTEERDRVAGQAAEKVAQAEIEAKTIVGAAARYKATVIASTDAQVDALKILIESAGDSVDNAIQLEVARIQTALAENGVINRVILTGDSVLGRAFYPSEVTGAAAE